MSVVRVWMQYALNVARVSKEECLLYLARKKKRKVTHALQNERQGTDGRDVVPIHGSSNWQKPNFMSQVKLWAASRS